MTTPRSGRLGSWMATVLEVPRIWLDRDLRIRMTDLLAAARDGGKP
jgi:hypothetical protein